MIVYVVLHANYGDQGVDFHKVFASKEKAEAYIEKHINDSGWREDEKQWFSIREEVVN